MFRATLPVLRAQEQSAYLVRSALVGRLGLSFCGHTGLYAPFAITPAGDGVLLDFADESQSGVVVGHTDLDRLSDGVDNYCGDFNSFFYQERLLPLYRRPTPTDALPAPPLYTPPPDVAKILAEISLVATAPITLPQEPNPQDVRARLRVLKGRSPD